MKEEGISSHDLGLIERSQAELRPWIQSLIDRLALAEKVVEAFSAYDDMNRQIKASQFRVFGPDGIDSGMFKSALATTNALYRKIVEALAAYDAINCKHEVRINRITDEPDKKCHKCGYTFTPSSPNKEMP